MKRKIVIELEEEDYKLIKDIPDGHFDLTSNYFVKRVYKAIRDGVEKSKEVKSR